MLNQILNISDVNLFNTVKTNADASALPANNTVVSISVLDKIGPEYKLLVNGKVFSSVLPVNVQTGEVLLGLIKNNNPMTISLINLLSAGNMTGQNLSALITKLGLKITETNINLLKALAVNKKPALKSKIEKFAEALENLDFQFDEQQLNYFVQIFTNESNYQDLNGKNAGYFRYPLNDVMQQIYEAVKNGSNSALSKIVIEFAAEPDYVSLQKEIVGGMMNRDAAISEWIKENAGSGEAETKRLADLFSMYLAQKSFLKKENIYPGFIIISKDGNKELVEYKLQKSSSGDGNVFYLINLEMKSKELGKIAIDGTLAKSALNLRFGTDDNKRTAFEEEKENLADSIKNNLGLNPLINFYSGNESTRLKKYNTAALNVRI
jgi:hypothetical protein